MNIFSRLIFVAAVAFITSFGVHADEVDASEFATKFEAKRTRAEVAAEGASVTQTRFIEPAGSRVVTYRSTAERSAVHALAAEAVRSGQIPAGETGTM